MLLASVIPPRTIHLANIASSIHVANIVSAICPWHFSSFSSGSSHPKIKEIPESNSIETLEVNKGAQFLILNTPRTSFCATSGFGLGV
jgi:hypothetical protein